MSQRINFDQLFTVTDQIAVAKVRISIMSIVRGGPEYELHQGAFIINGVDPFSWQGKDLLVDQRLGPQGLEQYILGLARG